VIVDLVSSWAAAIESAPAQELWRARHTDLLEGLRRQRTPHAETYPLDTDRARLHHLAARASDPELRQLLRDMIGTAAGLGIDTTVSVVLVAGGDEGDAVEPLPGPAPEVVLFPGSCRDDTELVVALARGLVAVTRWSGGDSLSTVPAPRTGEWDRWRLARDIPLGEWIYTEGVGLHLAQHLLPLVPVHRLLGITIGALHRLRDREHSLRALLDTDLDQAGLGLVLRWLARDTPASTRTVGATVVPAGAGHYLAWRMVAERVERVGIGEAVRMAVEKR
jgi:hypothetical protein